LIFKIYLVNFNSFWIIFIACWVQYAVKQAVWSLGYCKHLFTPRRTLKILFLRVKAIFFIKHFIQKVRELHPSVVSLSIFSLKNETSSFYHNMSNAEANCSLKKMMYKGHCSPHFTPLPLPPKNLNNILLTLGKIFCIKTKTKPKTCNNSDLRVKQCRKQILSLPGLAGSGEEYGMTCPFSPPPGFLSQRLQKDLPSILSCTREAVAGQRYKEGTS